MPIPGWKELQVEINLQDQANSVVTSQPEAEVGLQEGKRRWTLLRCGCSQPSGHAWRLVTRQGLPLEIPRSLGGARITRDHVPGVPLPRVFSIRELVPADPQRQAVSGRARQQHWAIDEVWFSG